MMESCDANPFPSLSPEIIAGIEAHLQKQYKSAAPSISPESWEKLKPILAAYRKDAEFLRGFLNKGEATLSKGIATRSEKLLGDLAKAREKGIDRLVERAIDPLPLGAFEALLRSLATELTVEPRKDPFLPDDSRERLYQNFAAWWQIATGETPQIVDWQTGKIPEPPFMYVARVVFDLPDMPGPPGASYKSLKDFRRKTRDRDHRYQRLAELLADLSQSDRGGHGG